MGAATLVLGTRGSALALTQAALIRSRLSERGHTARLREITTTGDRIRDVPLSQIGDKALFTKELDTALLEGSIDLAVHSLKDLPTTLPAGLRIAAVTMREDPRDVFVAHPEYAGTFEKLPFGARLATSSLRRKAQILAWRPDIEIVPVRGNVDTRLQKLDDGDWHGLVLANAGLVRLGLSRRIRTLIDMRVMLPAVGQGALAVVCSEKDEETFALLQDALHDRDMGYAVAAERAFLGRLEGGCSVPVGAFASIDDAGSLSLDGCVASLDGQQLLRDERRASVEEAASLGVALAEALIRDGAEEILADIREASS